MRNALNAMQSTVSGFGHVSAQNVFKVCDQPHPLKLKACIQRYTFTHSFTHSLIHSLIHSFIYSSL
jgi:hypothetical protein